MFTFRIDRAAKSPHYMIQPNTSVIVPREKWDAKPLPSLPRISRKADDPSGSDK
jgi:hypothetical protein